ncbi:MAG: hypothetical protein CM1200mP41_39490 [Gammaproteobacteria bacterium]|nr:MAG: hypothetical protein CM1200mP41_39490 [Gammaproteobacteria bacterium]
MFMWGKKTAVALPGAKLSNGLKVKQRSIAGFSSNGMLCSSQELGLKEDSSGILWLDDELYWVEHSTTTWGWTMSYWISS